MILISLNEEGKGNASSWSGREEEHPHFSVRTAWNKRLPIEIQFRGNEGVVAERFITKGEARKIAMALLSTLIILETETED